MADLSPGNVAENEAIQTSDFSKLIDLGLLQLFGERTIVPMNGTIGTLAQAVAGLNGGVEGVIGSIAPEETSPAQTAHTVGSYLMYAGELYKVKTAIAVDDAIVTEGVNANVESTTLTHELENAGGALPFSVVNGMLCVTYEE